MAFTQQEINRLKELGLPTDGLETVRYDKNITDNFSQEEIDRLQKLGANIPLDENTTIGEDLSIAGSGLKRGLNSLVGGTLESLGNLTNSDTLKGMSDVLNDNNKEELAKLQKNQNIKQNMNNEDLLNWAKVSDFAGQSIPNIAGIILPGMGASKLAQGLGAGAKAVQGANLGTASLMGGLSQGGQAAVMAKDDAMARILQENPNISQEELNLKLDQIGKDVNLQSGILNTVGTLGSMAIGGAVGNRLASQTLGQDAKAIGTTILADQVVNIPTAVGEEVIQAENVGRDINNRNIATNLIMGGLVGGGIGGVTARNQARALGNEINTLNQAGLEVQQPQGFELLKRGIALPEDKATKKMEFLKQQNPDSNFELAQSNVNGKFFVVEKIEKLNNTSFNNEDSTLKNTVDTTIQDNNGNIIQDNANFNSVKTDMNGNLIQESIPRQEQFTNEYTIAKQEDIVAKQQEDLIRKQKINDGLNLKNEILNIQDPILKNQFIIENRDKIKKEVIDLLPIKEKSLFVKDIQISKTDNDQLLVTDKNTKRSKRDIVLTQDAETLIKNLGIKDIPELKENKVGLNENITNFKLNDDKSITATATLRGMQYTLRKPSDLSRKDTFNIKKELVTYKTKENETPVTENQYAVYDNTGEKVGVIPKEMANLFNKLDNNGKIDTNSFTVSQAKYEKMPFAELTNEYDANGTQRKVRITSEDTGKVTEKLLSDVLKGKGNEDYTIVKQTDDNGNFITDKNGNFIEVLARPIIDIKFNTLKPLEAEIVKGNVYNPKKEGLNLLDQAENLIRNEDSSIKEFISQKEYDSLNETGKKSYDKNETVKNKDAGAYKFNRYTESNIYTLKNKGDLVNENINKLSNEDRVKILEDYKIKNNYNGIIEDANNVNWKNIPIDERVSLREALDDESNKKSNGFTYIRPDGIPIVIINFNNIQKSKLYSKDTVNTSIDKIITHETFHAKANTKFKTIKEKEDFFNDIYKENKDVLDKFILAKTEQDDVYKNIDNAILIEEIMADISANSIVYKDKNGKVVEKSLNEFIKDKTFLQKVLDMLRNVLNKISGKELFKNEEIVFNQLKKQADDIRNSPLKKVERDFFNDKSIPEDTKDFVRVFYNSTTHAEREVALNNFTNKRINFVKNFTAGLLSKLNRDDISKSNPLKILSLQKWISESNYTNKAKLISNKLIHLENDLSNPESILYSNLSLIRDNLISKNDIEYFNNNSIRILNEISNGADINKYNINQNMKDLFKIAHKTMEDITLNKYQSFIKEKLSLNNLEIKNEAFIKHDDINSFINDYKNVYKNDTTYNNVLDSQNYSSFRNKNLLSFLDTKNMINNIPYKKVYVVKDINNNKIIDQVFNLDKKDLLSYKANKIALDGKYKNSNYKFEEIDLTLTENQRTLMADSILEQLIKDGKISKLDLLKNQLFNELSNIKKNELKSIENEINYLENSQEKNDLMKLLKYSRESEPELARQVKGFGSIIGLGFNPLTAAMNLSTYITTIPTYMIQNGFDLKTGLNTYKYMVKVLSNNNYLKWHTFGLTEATRDAKIKELKNILSKEFKKPEDLALIDKLLNSFEDSNMLGENPLHDLKNNLFENNGVISKGFNASIKVGMSAFAKTEKIVRTGVALTAIEAGIKQGKNFDEITSLAKDFLSKTQGTYSKENTSPIFRSPIGRLIGQFKTFPLNYAGFMAYTLKQAIKNPNLNTIGSAAWLWLSTILLGGTASIPFSEDLDDIIDTLGQFLGYKTNSKEFKDEIFSKATSKDFNYFMTYGVLPKLGMDNLVDKFQFKNIIPATAILKKSEVDKAAQIKEVTGMTGNLVTSYVSGINNLSDGNLKSAAIDLTPTGIKNIIKGLDALDKGYFVNQDGKKVKMSDNNEAYMKMFGLQSNELARYYREVKNEKQKDALIDLMKSQINKLYVKASVEKDESYKIKANNLLKDWNEQNPDSKIFLNRVAIQKMIKNANLTSRERFTKSLDKSLRKGFNERLDNQDNDDEEDN